MRNFTRYHLPSKEFSKIVRFNGKDYLLRSVYDDTVDVKNTEMDDVADMGLNLPWFKVAHSKHRRITEDFFSDMDDNDIILPSSETNMSDFSYTIYDTDGNSVELLLSDDSHKNQVFFLFSFIIAYSPKCTASAIDEIMYCSNPNHTVKTYKMFFSDIIYKNGTFQLVVDGRNGGCYIQAYFKSRTEVDFQICCATISNTSKKYSEFTYSEFCDLLKYDKQTSREKDYRDYYIDMTEKVVAKYKKSNINVTICSPKDADYVYTKGVELCDFGLLKNNFNVVDKINSKDLDMLRITKYVNASIDRAGYVYNGILDSVRSDDYWILIGGNEKYVDSFYNKSIWFCPPNIIRRGVDAVCVKAVVPNKEVRTKTDVHYMLFMPLGEFIAISPCILTHLS